MVDNEEVTIGDWMVDFEREERVRCRIACDELDYPQSEALYATVEEWELANKRDWLDYVASIA